MKLWLNGQKVSTFFFFPEEQEDIRVEEEDIVVEKYSESFSDNVDAPEDPQG